MDPISLSLAIGPLVLSSAKILAGLRSVRHKYKNAQTAVATTQTECEFLHVALCEVQAVVQRNRVELTARLQSQKDVGESFDKVLTGCRITLDALTLELDGILKSTEGETASSGDMGRRSKALYVWKKDTMEELMGQLKDQRDCIQFLITILQSGTQAEILILIKQNTHSIQKLLSKAKSIRSQQGFDDTQSLFTDVQSIRENPLENSYEKQLHRSPAYRKAQAAAAEDLLAAKLELLEEKYSLEDKLDSLGAEIILKDEALRSKDAALRSKDHLLNSQYEALMSKDGALDLRDRSLASLNQVVSRKTREIQQLQQENASIKSSYDGLSRNSEASEADQNAEQSLALSNNDLRSLLSMLKANEDTWISVPAFNWAAVRGKVGLFQIGEYSSASKDPDTQMNYLQTASAHGHVHVVEYLLSNKFTTSFPINGDDMTQWTEKKLEKCFDVNERTYGTSGLTALQLASQRGHDTVVKALLRAGADVNAHPWGLPRQTALQAAAANGHLDVVDTLLEHDARVNISETEEKGSSALQAAAAGGYREIVKKLLVRGAYSQDYAALRAAATGDHWEVVDILWDKAIKPDTDQTLFAYIISKGDVDIVKHLLRNSFPAANYSSLARLCVKRGNTEILKALISGCRSRGKHIRPGMSALREAVIIEDSTMVDLLLVERVRICIGNEIPTALDFAIEKNNIAILEQLLESASRNDQISQDCSKAYKHAVESARSHTQAATLLPILENSEFGQTAGVQTKVVKGVSFRLPPN